MRRIAAWLKLRDCLEKRIYEGEVTLTQHQTQLDCTQQYDKILKDIVEGKCLQAKIQTYQLILNYMDTLEENGE